jgi:Tol biopolymer transport system component
MPLTVGTRIGPYEILGAIGAGGMGEVYRARDSKLGRDVAIKALPDLFAKDPERVARFEREAQLLASLNHPHIAAIYGLEEVEGIKCLVLELVDGQSLAERLTAGALPVAESIALARQIVDALEAAHAKGIIHRDLKPGNIMVTVEGQVKVLDFGLAKALENEAVSSTSNSPTLTFAAATQAGVILGTAAYMSPEQARGRSADKRSDIWAFGCVLYEMLTATRPFAGDDITDTIAAVVRGEPDWTLLPRDMPPMLEVYLRRCLRKVPKERAQDIGDIRLVLEGAFDPPVSPTPPGSAPMPPAKAVRTAWLVPAALVLLVAGAAFAWWLKPAAPQAPAPVRRFALSTAPAALNIANANRDVALTSDGTRLIYFAGQGSGRQLYVRPLDALAGTAVRPAERWFEPFVSFDGRWIGFNDESDYTLRKASLTGGPPVTITALGTELLGASWGPDDTIVFAKREPGTGLWRVPAAGGTPVQLTTPDKTRGELQHSWPEFLPGGAAVLFTIQTGLGGRESEIAVVDLKTGKRKILGPGSNPKFAPSGHLVYGVEGTLSAVRFDPVRLETRGDPVPVLERVLTKSTGGADFSIAGDGTLVYLSGSGSSVRRQLAWIDRNGTRQPISAPPRAYVIPRISPDGSRAAIDIRDQESDIWSWDFARQTLSRLTTDSSFDGNPAWTPDGRRIVFASGRMGQLAVYAMAADGSGDAARLSEGPNPETPSAVTPDGAHVVFRRDAPGTGQDLLFLDLEGPHRTIPLLQSRFGERNGEVSPNGKWLVYDSNESGAYEVYVRPFPNADAGRWPISSGGGSQPLWTRDGREVIYAGIGNRLMSAAVEDGATFKAGTPRVVVEAPRFFGTLARTYDVSPDGKRFLIIEETDSGDAGAASMIVILNWTEELKRLLPGGR